MIDCIFCKKSIYHNQIPRHLKECTADDKFKSYFNEARHYRIAWQSLDEAHISNWQSLKYIVEKNIQNDLIKTRIASKLNKKIVVFWDDLQNNWESEIEKLFKS